MGFNFPNTPNIGDSFAPANGPIYVWDGLVWKMIGAPQALTAQAYNRIVNGAMQHSQENGNTASAATASGSYYAADQFYSTWNVSTGTMATYRSVAGVALNGEYYVSVASASGVTLAAGSYGIIRQAIEGVRLADFGWGTASAKQIIVRAMIYASVAGTITMKIGNGTPSTRCYLKEFTLPVATWTECIAVIPGDTAGTWVTDNNLGLIVDFTAAAGTTFKAPGVGWQAGNFYAGSNQTNILAAAGTGMNVARVGLYLDPDATGVPPKWQTPDYASELIACQRYWQQVMTLFSGSVTSGQLYHAATSTMATMRIVPTLSGVEVGGSAGFPATTGTLTADFINVIREQRSANGTVTGALFRSRINANARM